MAFVIEGKKKPRSESASERGFFVVMVKRIRKLERNVPEGAETEILIEAREILDLEVALVSIDTLMKNVERKMLHYLRENELAGVHGSNLRRLIREGDQSARNLSSR